MLSGAEGGCTQPGDGQGLSPLTPCLQRLEIPSWAALGWGGETLAVVVGLQEPLCPSEKDSAGEMGEFCALTTAFVKYFPEEKQRGILPSWETTMLSARLLQQIF